MHATELGEGSTQDNACSKLVNCDQMTPRLLQYYFLLGRRSGLQISGNFLQFSDGRSG